MLCSTFCPFRFIIWLSETSGRFARGTVLTFCARPVWAGACDARCEQSLRSCSNCVRLSLLTTTAPLWHNRRNIACKTMKQTVLVLFVLWSSLCAAATESTSKSQAFDVLHYNVRIEPDISRKSVAGTVSIKLVATAKRVTEIELNCGALTIDSVREKGKAQKFVRRDNLLIISLITPATAGQRREIEIDYHGTPGWGIQFFPERQQVYTVFSTSRWMVCVDAPSDRATVQFQLILPAHLTGVSNGRLNGQRPLPNNRISYEWRQDFPIPTYIFGFAAGPFRTVTERRGRVELRYLATEFSDDELRRIFRDTASMIEFYEERSGVKYADTIYTQVLAAGGVAQEMSSFTAIHETYGREVLKNEKAVGLGAHELAHQWWGNMVTNRDWTHFWLNEGIASFMASAFKEYRFGRQEYLRDIEEYRANYEKVRNAGKDRSLVFPDWDRPTREDRTLVYDKGAYVVHLLRERLGEDAFWTGIRQYTRKYFGQSVTTPEFQAEMEKASQKDLTDFFDQWVYLRKKLF